MYNMKEEKREVIGNIITNYNPKYIKVKCEYDSKFKIFRIDVKLKKSKK
jgi:hypothetical protein